MEKRDSRLRLGFNSKRAMPVGTSAVPGRRVCLGHLESLFGPWRLGGKRLASVHALLLQALHPSKESRRHQKRLRRVP